MIIVLFFIGMSMLWLKLVPQNQISDFGYFWSKAPSALAGKPLFTDSNEYFAKYAYQSGFMLYIMALVKIFGQNILVMQLGNILVQSLILIVTYFLSMKIFQNVKIARVTAILLSLDLDWFALNSQADNQYLGSLLFLITIYLVLINRFWSIGLSGLTLALGWIIRPIGPVIFIAVILYVLIFASDPKKSLKMAKTLMLSLICFATLSGTGFLVKSSGLNPYGLKNTDTEWKLIAGLNVESNGSYSAKLDKYLNQSSSRSINKQHEKEVLKDEIRRLNETHGWLKLMLVKLSTLWARGTDLMSFTQFNVVHSARSTMLVSYEGFLIGYLITFFSWIGSIHLFKNVKNRKVQLLILPIIGFTVIELLIEVQGRYRIELLPLLAIVSGWGALFLLQQLEKNRYLNSIGAKILNSIGSTLRLLSKPFS